MIIAEVSGFEWYNYQKNNSQCVILAPLKHPNHTTLGQSAKNSKVRSQFGKFQENFITPFHQYFLIVVYYYWL